jgi:hypothetical protein
MFRERLDDREHKLGSILTRYYFAALMPCGRDGCRQPHKDGFLVKTEDGLETNVGNKCGANFFGEAVWAIKKNEFTAQEARRSRIARVSALIEDRHKVSQQIANLYNRPFGFQWQKALTAALQGAMGSDLVEALRQDQRRQTLDVEQTRQRTNDEIEAMAEQTGRPKSAFQYETLKVGRLEAMPWLVFNAKAELIDGIRDPLADLASINFDSLTAAEQRRRLKEFDQMDHVLNAAEDACTSASLFLAQGNLDLLMLWIPAYKSPRRKAVDAWKLSPSFQTLSSGLAQ